MNNSGNFTISILVPVYGVEKYIERCARSIFEQSYKNLEIIFVDDCSPDHSIDILTRVLNDYPERRQQTRILRHKANRGLAASRNTLLEAATGDFVYNIDSDDYLELNGIELLSSKQMETDADIVTGYMIINDSEWDNHYIEPEYHSKEEMLETLTTDIWHHELAGRLVRRSLFIHHNLRWTEGLNQEEDMYMTPRIVYYAKKIALVKHAVYHYVMSEDSMCSVFKDQSNTRIIMEGSTQGYLNSKSVALFFKDKDEHLYHNMLRMILPRCYGIMWNYLGNKDKQNYLEWRKEFLSYGSKLWDYFPRLRKSVIRYLLYFPLSYYIIPAYMKTRGVIINNATR